MTQTSRIFFPWKISMAWGQWQLAVWLLQCMRDLRIQQDEISLFVALIALTWFVAQRMPRWGLSAMHALLAPTERLCAGYNSVISAFSKAPEWGKTPASCSLVYCIFLHKHLHVWVVIVVCNMISHDYIVGDAQLHMTLYKYIYIYTDCILYLHIYTHV